MNDRELLEAAARAAELRVKSDRDSTWIVEDDGSPVRRWSPLTDDGDRYRLARAVGLRIDWQLHRVLAMDGTIYDWTTSGHGDDEAHAIVRAAAAMAPKETT
jgi:hypothetical protein